MLESYIPILGTIIVGAVFGIVMVKLHEWLGPRRANQEKASPYESGMEPVTSIKERHTVKFYLVAMLFILFDIEIIFMYPWAIQFMDSLKDGSGGYMLGVMGVFVLLFVIGLIWEVKSKALDWK